MKNFFYILVLFPILVIGQTQSENYIKNTTYKIPTTTSVTSPTIMQAKQSIGYYDGLGRVIQKVDSKQSGNGKNIVTHIEYDLYGRQLREYLPYVTHSNGLNYESNAGTNVLTYPLYTGQNPYSEKQIEASPLDRVLKQASPGVDWTMGNGHEIKYDYLTNADNDEVKYYQASAAWNSTNEVYEISLVQNGTTNYPINSLYKSVTKNENWVNGKDNTVESYKNKENQLVLKRTFDNNIAHDIYYVYDQFGNLTYVIPPLVTNVTTQMDGLCYQYKYDRLNRLVEKKLPGKNWEFIIYDKLDRIVAAGPVSSPFTDIVNDGWLITKYDMLNRAVYTGWYSDNVSATVRKTLQSIQNSLTTNVNEKKLASGTIDGVNVFYSNQVVPTSFKLLSVNYFDDYNFPDAPSTIPSFVLNGNGQEVYYNNTIKPKGLPTGMWLRALESSTTNNYEKNYILYDKKGRIVRKNNKNYLGGYLQQDYGLDFSGKTLYSETRQKRLNNNSELFITNEFIYTDQDRLLSNIQKINGGFSELLFKNEYDELGRLIVKNTGGTDLSGAVPLQRINYSYNIRGWLTGINNIDNLIQGTDPVDLFAFKINYNTVQNENGYTGTALFNGNIAETYWRTQSDNILRKYGYKYDNLNRLRHAIYQKPGAQNPTPGSYNERAVYDKNGNITALSRSGNLDSPVFTIDIDDLTYTYIDNRLMRVNDATNNPAGFADNGYGNTYDDYAYDVKGNLIKDENKKITNIIYNHLNLPVAIFFSNGNKINYIYNAAGVKLQKKITDFDTEKTIDYLGGFQYENNILKFFPHPEGYVNVTNGTAFNYVYNYTDHLGNIRATWAFDNKSGTIKIMEENHYYPFGLKHTAYNTQQYAFTLSMDGAPGYNLPILEQQSSKGTPNPNRYKYNGKELQEEFELNIYDYGARNYDPALGRWMNIDPLAEASRRFSPYVYANNNPILFIDPDGMLVRPSNGIGDPSKDYFAMDEKDLKEKVADNNENYIENAVAETDPPKPGGGTNSGWKETKNPDGSPSGNIAPTEQLNEVVINVRSKSHPYFRATPSGEYGFKSIRFDFSSIFSWITDRQSGYIFNDGDIKSDFTGDKVGKNGVLYGVMQTPWAPGAEVNTINFGQNLKDFKTFSDIFSNKLEMTKVFRDEQNTTPADIKRDSTTEIFMINMRHGVMRADSPKERDSLVKLPNATGGVQTIKF